MKQIERNCMIHAWSDSSARPIVLGSVQFLAPILPVHARKHPGSVASMTRDKGYPDWLVLSARLLWAAILQARLHWYKIYMFWVVFGLWLCEDITACCYMYCYFHNIFPPWSSQMTIILITNAMYHIRYKNSEYEFKRKKPPLINYSKTSTSPTENGKPPFYTGG